MDSAGTAMSDSVYAQNICLRGRAQQTICALLDKPLNALQHYYWKFSRKETS